ncbi:MAG: putative lipid II flippase FtsW, partial [Zetaproteobacteria bacterium]
MRLEREFAVMLGHVAVLMAISIVAVASASLDVAAARYGDAFLILRRWLAYWVVGWAVLGLSAYAPWDRLRRASFALVLGVVVLALLPLVPKLGVRINGAARWITLGGITLQPAEFLKPALVLYLAHYFDRKGDEGQSGRAIVPPLVVVGLSAVALLLQPDFGDAVLLVGVALAMAVAAGVPGRLLVLVLVLGALAAAAVATYAPYRFARLLAFIDPWAHRWDSGYQLAQSLLAFGSGGLFGTGVGLGIQKLFYLPEVFTDFIAAAWAEETGFIGVLALLGTFVVLIVRMLAWA